MKHKMDRSVISGLVLLVTLGASVFAADWPHWRGPDRSGISAETDWNPKALSDSTKPLWTASVGTGFSAVSVADGKAVTMGNVDKTTDVVTCLDALTGQLLWTYRYEEPLTPNLYEGGPNATPAIHEKKVYTVSKSGEILCLDLEKGTLIWRRQTDCKKPEWGFAGSPVIVEDKVIYNIGSGGLALHKQTGEILWESGKEEPGYATAVPFTMDGKTQVALLSKEQLYSVNPADGKVLWSYPWKTSYDVNASDPVVKDGEVLITSGYDHGAAVVKITANGPAAVWENKNLRSHLSGPVVIDGFIYGIDENQLACLDWKTGQVRWIEKAIGKGSLTAAGDKLIVLSEKGRLIIAQASPDRFDVLSSAQILSGRCWTTPVLAGGRIYARNARGDLVCIDVRNPGAAWLLDSEPVITAAELGGDSASKDWPCWNGPDHNNKSSETGLLKQWPVEGPALLWSADDLGNGFSPVSVANQKIYVTGMKDKRGVLSCLDWNGTLVWTADYGPEWTGSHPGVRNAPAVWDG
jgi:outer membrane protein assembly factor BamB